MEDEKGLSPEPNDTEGAMDEDHITSGPTQTQLILLFTAVFIDLLGFGIVIPILPYLVTGTFSGNSLDYGLIIAAYSLMQFIFAPIWGAISDKIGRKSIIIIGLGGSVIGFGIFGLASSIWYLYASRIIAGIFTAATLTVANAYIADVSPPEQRGANFGIIAAAFGLGFAIGPGLGGLIAKYELFGFLGWQLAAFLSSLLALLNMIAALFFLPESLDPAKRKKELDLNMPIFQTRKYIEHEDLLWYIGIFALASLGFSLFIAAFPLFAEDINPLPNDAVNETTLGYYFTYAGILLFLSQTLLIRPLIKIVGEEIIVKIGVILVFIGFVSVTFAPTYWWTFLTNTPLILGISFLNPSTTSLISNSAPQNIQGEVLGVNQAWASFMRIIGPIFGGWLYGEFAKEVPFYVGAGLFGILLILVFSKVDKSPGLEEEMSLNIPLGSD